MAVDKLTRRALCAMPQPGWGGTTLAGYTESIGLRPDVHGSEYECAGLLDRFIQAGFACSLGGDPERWELTETGHDLVVGPAEDARTDGKVSEILLELQPNVGSTGAAATTMTGDSDDANG